MPTRIPLPLLRSSIQLYRQLTTTCPRLALAPLKTLPRKKIPFLPMIFQPSLYSPTVRVRPTLPGDKTPYWQRPWNPATFYIWMLMLIGSNAIQFLNIRHQTNEFMLRADARISMLREVVDKLMKGEEVDVKKALGTGNELDEHEWAMVMREMEKDDDRWVQNMRDKELARKLCEEEEAIKKETGEEGEPKRVVEGERTGTGKRRLTAEDFEFS